MKLVHRKSDLPVQVLALCKNKRVLMVDDVKLNRTLLAKMLTKRGMLVTEAADGMEALLKCGVSVQDSSPRTFSFDAIIMDSHMPRMGGAEAVEAMRAHGVRCPIFGLTGDSSQLERDKLLYAGVNAVMIKPVNFTKLINSK